MAVNTSCSTGKVNISCAWRSKRVGLARTIYIRCIYIRYFKQGISNNHQMYGHIRCIYTVLASPIIEWAVSKGEQHYVNRHNTPKECNTPKGRRTPKAHKDIMPPNLHEQTMESTLQQTRTTSAEEEDLSWRPTQCCDTDLHSLFKWESTL
jgi:hypothetical protein